MTTAKTAAANFVVPYGDDGHELPAPLEPLAHHPRAICIKTQRDLCLRDKDCRRGDADERKAVQLAVQIARGGGNTRAIFP